MKKLIMILLVCTGALWAQNYKAVYDLSMDDMRYVLNRVMLIEKTAAMLKERGDVPEFVVTIHSGATPILAKLPDAYADEEEVPVIYSIQARLKSLVETYGVRVLGCNLATAAFGMEHDEVVGFVEQTPNSIIDLIGLQNSGYAAVYFLR